MTDPEEPDTALVEEIHENGAVKPDGDSEESNPDTNPPGPARKAYVKKYPKPDDTQLKRECEALSSQIEQHKSKIEEIKQLIGSKSESRRSGGGAQQQVRAKLADLRQQFQAELARKQQFRADLDGATKARDALRAQAREMRTKLAYATVEQIDAQIANLETRMAHTTMTLQEEKRTLEEIKKLKSSRELVGSYNARLEKLNADDDVRTQIVEKLKGCDERLGVIKQQEEAARAELAVIREQEQAKTGDIPGLIKEREESRHIIDIAYAKIKELRAAFKAEVDAWYANERAFREQRNEERKKRQEEYEAERKARDAERKAREAELRGDPFVKEITMCEQLTSYLNKFMSAAEAVVTNISVDARTAELEGLKVFKKADIEEDVLDGWGKLTERSKKGKGAKKAAMKAQSAVKSKSADTKLTHPLETIAAFGKLKLDMPLTTSQVPAALKAIKDKWDFYKEKQARVKANDGIDPDAPEEVAEPMANGIKEEKKEAIFELDDTLAFPEVGGPKAVRPESPPHVPEADEPPEAPAPVDDLTAVDEPSAADEEPSKPLPEVVASGVQVSLRVGDVSDDVAVKLTVNGSSNPIEVA